MVGWYHKSRINVVPIDLSKKIENNRRVFYSVQTINRSEKDLPMRPFDLDVWLIHRSWESSIQVSSQSIQGFFCTRFRSVKISNSRSYQKIIFLNWACCAKSLLIYIKLSSSIYFSWFGKSTAKHYEWFKTLIIVSTNEFQQLYIQIKWLESSTKSH